VRGVVLAAALAFSAQAQDTSVRPGTETPKGREEGGRSAPEIDWSATNPDLVRDPTVDRFPTGQAAARRRAEQQTDLDEQRRQELVNDPDNAVSGACSDLSAEQRLSCPLSPDTVEAIEPISRGVRMRMRQGTAADSVTRALDCQASVAQVQPERPPLCSFADGSIEHRVSEREGRVHVELLVPTPDLDAADGLRARVRAAFPRAR
jgi:hypothetical protein